MRALRLLPLLLTLPALSGCAAVQDLFGDQTPPRPVTFEALHLETSLGAVTAILYAQEAPQTVEFIKRLVREGYYDGREFNRVIPGFVVQEVDRLGGATDQTDTVPLEAGTDAHFSMGAFGIARNEDPNSGGSEFFIMDFAHSHLYGNYTAFAQVVAGMDVVHAMARVDAINTRQGPLGQVPGAPAPLPVGVHDRVAVQPAVIESASITTVSLAADVAAQYPRVVGARTVVDSPPTRYTPEWPANLAPRVPAAMTWFVYTPPDEPMPDLRSVRALVERPNGQQASFALLPDPADSRILHWTWAPAETGAHVLALEVGGKVVARNDVRVG